MSSKRYGQKLKDGSVVDWRRKRRIERRERKQKLKTVSILKAYLLDKKYGKMILE